MTAARDLGFPKVALVILSQPRNTTAIRTMEAAWVALAGLVVSVVAFFVGRLSEAHVRGKKEGTADALLSHIQDRLAALEHSEFDRRIIVIEERHQHIASALEALQHDMQSVLSRTNDIATALAVATAKRGDLPSIG